jgi:hypothetical protein
MTDETNEKRTEPRSKWGSGKGTGRTTREAICARQKEEIERREGDQRRVMAFESVGMPD